MKVALIDTYGAWTHSSLALRYLEGYALQDPKLAESLEMEIHSLPMAWLGSRLAPSKACYDPIEKIAAFAPDAIGLSCYVWNLSELLNLAGILRKRVPGSFVFLGGPEVSTPVIAFRVLMECPDVSFIIMGEGEIPFRKLVNHMETGEASLADIPGLLFRKSGNEISVSPPGLIVENLNEIPSPFLTGRFSITSQCILVEMYRGCPNRCNYCTWSNKKHRRFSLSRTLNEIDVLIDSGVRYVCFIDSVFGPDPNRSRRVLEHIARKGEDGRGLPGFFVFPDPAHFDESLAIKLKETNCNLSFGLQSTNRRSLSKANRTVDLDHFRSMIRTANEYFPKYDVDLVYGLPGDTFADFLESFDWLAELNPPEIHSHRLLVLPGSVFHEKADEYGIVFEPMPPHRVLSTALLSAEDILSIERISLGIHLFYNCATVFFRLLRQKLKVKPSELIVDFMRWAQSDPILTDGGPVTAETLPPEVIFNSLDRHLSAKTQQMNSMDSAALLAALSFDEACYRCYKRFYFNNRRQAVGNHPDKVDGTLGSVLSEKPLVLVVSIPEEVAVLVPELKHSPGIRTPESQVEGMRLYQVDRHGYREVPDTPKLSEKANSPTRDGPLLDSLLRTKSPGGLKEKILRIIQPQRR